MQEAISRSALDGDKTLVAKCPLCFETYLKGPVAHFRRNCKFSKEFKDYKSRFPPSTHSQVKDCYHLPCPDCGKLFKSIATRAKHCVNGTCKGTPLSPLTGNNSDLEPPFVGESVDFKTSQTAFVPYNSTTPTFTPLHPSRLKFRSFGTEWKDIDVSAAEKLQTFTVETENSSKPADQLDKLLKTVYQICSGFFEETKRNLPRKQKSREEVILDQEKLECRLEMKQLRQELRKSGPSIENAVKWKEARTRMKRIFRMYRNLEKKNLFKKLQDKFRQNPFTAIKEELQKEDPQPPSLDIPEEKIIEHFKNNYCDNEKKKTDFTHP